MMYPIRPVASVHQRKNSAQPSFNSYAIIISRNGSIDTFEKCQESEQGDYQLQDSHSSLGSELRNIMTYLKQIFPLLFDPVGSFRAISRSVKGEAAPDIGDS